MPTLGGTQLMTSQFASRIAIALALAAPIPALAAPIDDPAVQPSITWDFIITSCPTCDGPSVGKTLAQLIIDGPNSSSIAENQTAKNSNQTRFYFSIPGYRESASYGYPPTSLNPPEVQYSISWTEVAGQLQAISVSFLTEFNEIKDLGLTSGFMGSDGTLDGCTFKLCAVTGQWLDASGGDTPGAVPEPSIWWLFGLAGLAISFARRGLSAEADSGTPVAC